MPCELSIRIFRVLVDKCRCAVVTISCLLIRLHPVQVSIPVTSHSILIMPAHKYRIRQDFLKRKENRKHEVVCQKVIQGGGKEKDSDMIAIEEDWPVSEAQMQKLLKSESTRDLAEMWMQECEKSIDANGLSDAPYVYHIYIYTYIYDICVYIQLDTQRPMSSKDCLFFVLHRKGSVHV